MRRLFRNLNLLLIISAVFLGLNFLPVHVVTNHEKSHSWEKFDKELVSSIQSVEDLLAYADSVADVKKIRKESLEYAIELDNIVKNRFTHSYSHYGFKDNWIAAVGGGVWKNFSAIVIPDDLLKYSYGACSQQSMVLMECMRKRGISYRTVYFPTHFALEARVGKNWFFFDPDMEPALTLLTITNLDSLSKSDKLYTIYRAYSDSVSLATSLSSFAYGKVNARQAPKTVIFHIVTKFLSKTLWLLPFLAYLLIRRKRRISKQGLVRRINEEPSFRTKVDSSTRSLITH